MQLFGFLFNKLGKNAINESGCLLSVEAMLKSTYFNIICMYFLQIEYYIVKKFARLK